MNAEQEERNDILFKKLVPSKDEASTLEGECLRAINRLLYRNFNDGDYWWKGYGIETTGPAEAFLSMYGPKDIQSLLRASDGVLGDKYTTILEEIHLKIINWIESRVEFTPNDTDMFLLETRYSKDDWESDDYYNEEEDDDFYDE